MANKPTLSESTIRSYASSSSFERGYDYYEQGDVLSVVQRGNLLTAEVSGSDYRPYEIQITLAGDGVKTAVCSCPYDWGGYCKHIIAVLLHYIHEPDAVEQQVELETLLADLTAEQLKSLIVNIAAGNLEFMREIERELQWAKVLPTEEGADTPVVSQVDVTAVQRAIRQGMKNMGPKGYDDYYYYEEGGGDQELHQLLEPYLEQTQALLITGDVDGARVLIMAVMQAFTDNLDLIEDYYEYTEGSYDGDTDLGMVLAEVILSCDLTGKARQDWRDKVAAWEDEIGDELVLAATAVEQGWDYPPLAAVLAGNITNKGAWEDEAPWYADELAEVRLNILERQGRQQEFLYLAEAEGQMERYLHMLVQTGDVAKAVTDAKQYLTQAGQILSLAKRLYELGEVTAVLELGTHGLNLPKDHWGYQKGQLAQWLRDVAKEAGSTPLALHAAKVAFLSTHTLADYTAVQHMAGVEWDNIKQPLLDSLAKSHYSAGKLDVFLQEGMLTAVMLEMDKNYRVYSGDLLRVLEATKEKYPDWGIQKCKNLAEEIMDAGRAKDYDTAVNWTRRARDIYLLHQRQAEWHSYIDGLLSKHGRKYKLVPMLKNIR